MPNTAGSIPESSMFGSICGGGFGTKPTLTGRIAIAVTSGAMFRGAKATLSSFSDEGVEPALRIARHWKKRAAGLETGPLDPSPLTACHELHVSFGDSELPLRVSMTAFPEERHQTRPHAAVPFASSTADS